MYCKRSYVNLGDDLVISSSDVAHLADSFQGLPDANATVNTWLQSPKSTVEPTQGGVAAPLGGSASSWHLILAHVLHYPPPRPPPLTALY
jgi:hypothetical protein